MKEQIVDYVNQLFSKVDSGEMKAGAAYSELYQIEKAVQATRKEITDSVLSELDKYDKRDLPVYDGFRLTVASRAVWKYRDPQLDRLKQLAKEREKAMQSAAAFNLKHSELMVDENGEIIPPAEKSNTTYIKMEYVK